MRLAGRCKKCGQSCEWIRDDATMALTPGYPCGSPQGGVCEPETPGDALVRRISDHSQKLASQRSRGFISRGKRR